MSETRVITVSGSGHGAGKTLLVEKLLPCLPQSAAIKASVEMEEQLDIAAETDPGCSPGKDTGRYLAAGASKAYFIRGPRDSVLAAVREVISSGEFDVVVVETNALVGSLKAGLRIFVREDRVTKPGAEECERLADVIVGGVSTKKPQTLEERRMTEIKEEVRLQSKDNKIACRKALELAKNLGVNPKEVGQAANEEGIKIVSCQLGCFE